MTTATTAYYGPTFGQDEWQTHGPSQQQEKSFNDYWGGVYQHVKERKPEDIIKLLHHLLSSIVEPTISQKNLRLIKFLDQWMAEPDDLGEEFWNEFCEDIEKNRFTI